MAEQNGPVGFHRVSPPDYDGDPWYQDHKTGMFFQFLGSSWNRYNVQEMRPEDQVSAGLRWARERYGNLPTAFQVARQKMQAQQIADNQETPEARGEQGDSNE